MVVERVRFHQIDDVESIELSSLDILNIKVKPLGVSSGIIIGLQD